MKIDTPWDFVKNCFLKETPILSNSETQNFYHPCLRLMSFHPSLLKTMAQMTLLQTGIPDWAMGCTLYHLTPKVHKVPYVKYVSAKSVTAEESKELEAVKKIFCVNTKHGLQLVEILKQQKIGLGEKGRKKKK